MNHEAADIRLKCTYDLDAPRGVSGRNSKNSMILDRLGSEPFIWLRDGLARAYRSMEREIAKEAVKQEFELLEASPG